MLDLDPLEIELRLLPKDGALLSLEQGWFTVGDLEEMVAELKAARIIARAVSAYYDFAAALIASGREGVELALTLLPQVDHYMNAVHAAFEAYKEVVRAGVAKRLEP